MKNLTKVMEGTMNQYLRQKKKLGEKKILPNTEKEISLRGYRRWPENAPLLSYYDRGYTELRVAGIDIIREIKNYKTA